MTLHTASPDLRPQGCWRAWLSTYRARTTWAEQAYEEFLASFDDDTRRHVGTHHPEVRVVAYGPTQVGKTTLILRLLGLSDDATQQAQRVLRGGRPQGNSATASAMRYRLTRDENWSWSFGSDVLPSAQPEDIIARLKQFRSDVPDTPHTAGMATVGIPRTYMEVALQPSSVSIIDLPGIHSAEEHERAHVRRLAGDYLPSADAILLVGRADGLQFLDKEAAELPVIDWRRAPHRFRIVLTHALTLATVREALQQHVTPIPFEALVEHHLEQAATFGYDPALLRPMMFPLDFGDSWLTAAKTTYGALGREANHQAFARLRASLFALGSPETRIAQAFQAHRVAAAIHSERAEDVDVQMEDAQHRLATIDRRIHFAEVVLRSAERARARSQQAEASMQAGLAATPSRCSSAELMPLLREKAADGMLLYRRFAQEELREALEERITDWVRWAEDVGVERRVLDSAAAALRVHKESWLESAAAAVKASWHQGEGLARWRTYGGRERAVSRTIAVRQASLDDIDNHAQSLMRSAQQVAIAGSEATATAGRRCSVVRHRLLRLQSARFLAAQRVDALSTQRTAHREVASGRVVYG